MYKNENLRGGHVIKLGPGNDEAAKEALSEWPGETFACSEIKRYRRINQNPSL